MGAAAGLGWIEDYGEADGTFCGFEVRFLRHCLYNYYRMSDQA